MKSVLRVRLRDFNFILPVWKMLDHCQHRLQVQGDAKDGGLRACEEMKCKESLNQSVSGRMNPDAD